MERNVLMQALAKVPELDSSALAEATENTLVEVPAVSNVVVYLDVEAGSASSVGPIVAVSPCADMLELRTSKKCVLVEYDKVAGLEYRHENASPRRAGFTG